MTAGPFRLATRPRADEVSDERLRRDLDWLLTCPSLCTDEKVIELLDLVGVKADPDLGLVREFLDSNAWHRVGYYFESFIDALLRGNDNIRDFRHSIQVFEGKRTLGELDFIFDWYKPAPAETKALTHLEVALKYYLHYLPEHASGSHFMGPNAMDNFEKKWKKLDEKQLPFGRQHFPEIQQSVAIVKGQIFYHPDQEAPASFPKQMNPDHRRGVWIRESELDWFSQFEEGIAGAILQKPFWFGAPLEGISLPALASEITTHFAERHHPLLVSVTKRCDLGIEELARLFVVSDRWPDDQNG